MAKSSYDKSLDVVHHEVAVKVGTGEDQYRLKIRVRSYNGGEMKVAVERVQPGKQNGFSLKRLSAAELEASLEAMADCLSFIQEQKPAEKASGKGNKRAA